MTLVGAAMASAWLSILVNAICQKLGHGDEANFIFLLIAGLAALLFRSSKSGTLRVDASFAFVFFLFAPLGRVLLKRDIAGVYLVIVSLLAIICAYFLCSGTFSAGDE
jgi:hypothetical protein